jgi:hypothetical protein
LLGLIGWEGVVNVDSRKNDCVRCHKTTIITTTFDFIDIVILFIMTTSLAFDLNLQYLWNSLQKILPKRNMIEPRQGGPAHKYVVIGIIRQERSVPLERLRYVTREAGLFKQIYIASLLLRPPREQWVSLKRITGFGIYKCHPGEDYHTMIDCDNATKRALAELFKDYQTRFWGYEDYGDRWMNWIHTKFNNSDNDPKNGRYSLQLILGWSIPKLVFWGIAPILLSLAIGIWYMLTPPPGADQVAVVQTAWTIASYIVTAAACKKQPSLRKYELMNIVAIGILAAITQLGHV